MGVYAPAIRDLRNEVQAAAGRGLYSGISIRRREAGPRIAHLATDELPIARGLNTEIYRLAVAARVQQAVRDQFIDEKAHRFMQFGP